MNKFFYLFVALFAIGLSSCSKDDVNPEIGASTTLKVSIAGIGVSTKSHSVAMPIDGGGTVGTDEATINRVTIAVFKAASANTVNGSDPVDVIYEGTPSGSQVVVPVTAGNRSVLVVANAPAGAFNGVTTRSAFLSTVLSLDLTAKGNDGSLAVVQTSQSTKNLPMEGEISYGLGNSTINTGVTSTASVTLARLVARISISKIVAVFSGAYSSATFTPESVFLYNANNSGTWGTNSFTGLFDGSTVSSYLQETISDYSTSNTLGIVNPYYFYTFPNSSTTNPTKLVIKGTFDADGAATLISPKVVYYPIVINLKNSNTTGESTLGTAEVQANRAYNLTATIKGEGSTGPSIDITPVNLTVDVSVQNWTAVAQDVTFN